MSFFVVLACASSYAQADANRSVSQLVCGERTYTAETELAAGSPAPAQGVRSQTIFPGNDRARALALMSRPPEKTSPEQPLLEVAVDQWGCAVKPSKAAYLLLSYACASGDCGEGRTQWYQAFDVKTGHDITHGCKENARCVQRRLRAFGLWRLLDDVSLESVRASDETKVRKDDS
ncbi:hypothetical protein [Pseudomonas mangiferae]|uniref:Uncharacterized protein n=1 Tax=Pseudomonas mangiferae TaxID=2593654 RepID=A0A553H2V0_9PSED|nr:hypothetical protein [Pseudomonas mangiferae]TRX76074.1 hypothetical protein FM069_02485 [Pseudomonas mangiferae]